MVKKEHEIVDSRIEALQQFFMYTTLSSKQKKEIMGGYIDAYYKIMERTNLEKVDLPFTEKQLSLNRERGIRMINRGGYILPSGIRIVHFDIQKVKSEAVERVSFLDDIRSSARVRNQIVVTKEWWTLDPIGSFGRNGVMSRTDMDVLCKAFELSVSNKRVEAGNSLINNMGNIGLDVPEPIRPLINNSWLLML